MTVEFRRALLNPMPKPLGSKQSGIPGLVWSCVHCEGYGMYKGESCGVCAGWGFTGDPIGPFGHLLDVLPESEEWKNIVRDGV